MATPRAGVLSIYIGTEPVEVGDSVDYDVATQKVETAEGLAGPVGPVVTGATPFATFEIVVTDDTDLEALVDPAKRRDVTINMRNGQSVVLYQAWHVGERPVNDKGRVSLTYNAKKGAVI